MGGNRGSQGIQYGRGQTSSFTTGSMFAEHRDQLSQWWNKEIFSLVDQALLMCEMFDPSTSRYAQVVCAATKKNDRENRKKGYEVQIEGPYAVEKLQKIIKNIQSNDQIHSQASMEEATEKI